MGRAPPGGFAVSVAGTHCAASENLAHSHRGPSYCLSHPHTPHVSPLSGGSHVTRLHPQVPVGTQGGVQGDPGQSDEAAAPPRPSLGWA